RKAAAERAARDAARPGAPAPAAAATAVPSGPALQVGGLGWPLTGALVTGYGGKLPDGRSSDGLLIGAGAGAPVKAVADGQVAYAEWMTGYGLLLIVDHGNGYMSLYAHNDALLKDPGDAVKRGDPVATVGSSGGHGRAALYFELRRNGQPVNPNVWLKK
ncbi:MAG: peptidoglycan DD-metalloendopeptidase family protein, partial [Pseudomonadota bacterium]|nr:peptidoglycan DD-metalloendopeptidase family protein [Pseudomonadota bacterium]